MATRDGDITIDGKDYRIHIDSANIKDIIDFAPRAATPGGSVVHSLLDMWQPMRQDTWHHGFGFHDYSDESGYMRTEGNVEVRYPGIAMLNTVPVESDATLGNITGQVNFNGKQYAFGAGGLFEYSGGSWSNIYSAQAVLSAIATGTYLFYSPGGNARIRKMTTGGTHSETGTNANSTGYNQFVVYKGNVYASKNSESTIYYDSNPDLSQLHGDPIDSTKEILVGFTGEPVLKMVIYSGNMYIFKATGVWMLTDDQKATPLLTYADQRSSSNFRDVVIYGGYMLYPVRDVIYQWNGSRENFVTPRKINDEFPYTTYGAFDNFAVGNSFAYMTGVSNESPEVTAILSYNNTGHFLIENVITDGDGEVTMMEFDPDLNRLWYHVSRPSAGTEKLYYIQLQEKSDLPYANFPTTGSHALIMSRWDMGFRDIFKAAYAIRVEGTNLTAARYLKISYSIDGAAWYEWGGTDNGRVTVDGVTLLTTPDDIGADPTIEFHQLKLKVEFITDDAAESPVLEGLTLRFIMRPDVRWGWSYNLPMAPFMDDGGQRESRSVNTMLDDLKAIRDSKAPVLFRDHFDQEFWVYITGIRKQALEDHMMAFGGGPTIESVATISLVEVIAKA